MKEEVTAIIPEMERLIQILENHIEAPGANPVVYENLVHIYRTLLKSATMLEAYCDENEALWKVVHGTG